MEETDYCEKCKTRYAVRDGCRCHKVAILTGNPGLGIALAKAVAATRLLQQKDTQ